MSKHVYIIFLAMLTGHCFAAESSDDQPKPTSYFDEMQAQKRAEDLRDGASYAAEFLKEFAKFFPESDRRYTAVAGLTEQCILQRNSRACTELVKTVEEFFAIAQSRCAHEGMGQIFAVAKELSAIHHLPDESKRDPKVEADRVRLAKEMNSLIRANECHLCSSHDDFNTLLVRQHPTKAFYASKAHENFYAHLLLQREVATRSITNRIVFVSKAPFTIILSKAKEIHGIHVSEKSFPSFSFFPPRKCENDYYYKEQHFYGEREPFKKTYPRPKSRLQE